MRTGGNFKRSGVASVGVVIFDGFQIMGLAALSAFEFANHALGREAYAVELLSEHGGPVRNSLGFTVDTKRVEAGRFDTLIVLSTLNREMPPPGLIACVKELAGRSRRVAGICTGAFILAEAGLLDGRRATTHWACADRLQRQFPNIKVEPDRIFVTDKNIWTSAGMSAGIDLALALVEDDFDSEIAKQVARTLVVYLRRTGGQSQFSSLIELEPKSDRIRRALVHAKEHLTSTLTVEELAKVAHLSPRQFSRIFREETGQSPAKAIERLRLDAARAMIEEGRHSVDEAAQHTGFAGRERMRRAFLRTYGQPPQFIMRSAKNARLAAP